MGRLAAALLLLLAASGSGAAADWAQAVGQRNWSFPRDHGAHPEYRTEWWYFTGNLQDDAGKRYGYQLTFFRQGLRLEARLPENPWSVRDVYLAHFAVTDAASGTFRFSERTSRAGPGLAGARAETLDAWLLDWSARMEQGQVLLKARTPDIELSLRLTPRKPIVLHGRDGLSAKGPKPGQASYYASFTDLETRGTLRTSPGGEGIPVTGTSWFDQEFGSNQLSVEQAGWDWLSLHLTDGRDLMVYRIRRADGSLEPASSGTLVESDGRSRNLPLADLRLEVLDHWKSPHTQARYPSRWRLSVPSAGIELALEPWVADQELVTEASTGVTYWEGAVGGKGRSGGRDVTCEGYVELTGYGGRIGGLF